MTTVVVFDDERVFRAQPEGQEVVYCRTPAEFDAYVDSDAPIDALALDHDLGMDVTTREFVTSRASVRRYVEMIHEGKRKYPTLVYVVTGSPAGGPWLMSEFRGSPGQVIRDPFGRRLGLITP